MTSIITALGEWLWPIVGAAFIALIGLLGAEQVRISNRDATIAQREAQVSQKNADIAKLEGDAASAVLAYSRKLAQAHEENDQQLTKANDDASTKTAAAESDKQMLQRTIDQLNGRVRARLAAATSVAHSGSASANLAAPSFGEAASPGSVYSELFGSAIGEAQRYAGIADAALIAGEQCQASYPVK